MKKLKITVIFSLVAAAVVAVAAPLVQTVPGGLGTVTQAEVLVLASASTAVPTTPATGRKALEIYNNGPYTIYCKPGGTGAVNTTRPIPPGASWYIEIADSVAVGCRAATADQVTTAATIATEIK